MTHDTERETDIVNGIASQVSFTGANLWVLFFAILIASLGLNINSTAVIIGAMLISPLMGPIIGMGLAIGINDLPLLKRAARNILIATAVSVATATVFFLLSPYKVAQSELLSRTAPTIYDILIALFGGAAGITGQCAKDKGNVIPGVAIATALMPPLCTAGFGIATGNLSFFFGAIFLFFINTVFITIATYVGVRLMKFTPIRFADEERRLMVHRTIAIVVGITLLPAGYMTVDLVRQSIFSRQLEDYSRHFLHWKNTQVVKQQVVGDSLLRIVAVGELIDEQQIAAAQKGMSTYSRLKSLRLDVIQGAARDSLEDAIILAAGGKDNNVATQQIAEELARIKRETASYREFASAAEDITPEVAMLFPPVRSITLMPVTESYTDTTRSKRYVQMVVKTRRGQSLSPAERSRLTAWIRTRIKADSVAVYVAQ